MTSDGDRDLEYLGERSEGLLYLVFLGGVLDLDLRYFPFPEASLLLPLCPIVLLSFRFGGLLPLSGEGDLLGEDEPLL